MSIRTGKYKHKTKNLILSQAVFTLHAEKQQTYQVNERVVLQRHWIYWLQHISRLDVARVFAIFTEKEEGLKDNLDRTLQRFRGLCEKVQVIP